MSPQYFVSHMQPRLLQQRTDHQVFQRNNVVHLSALSTRFPMPGVMNNGDENVVI
jgi:hypothetical protein